MSLASVYASFSKMIKSSIVSVPHFLRLALEIQPKVMRESK